MHLNKLIITNDQSFVPDGKLCIDEEAFLGGGQWRCNLRWGK